MLSNVAGDTNAAAYKEWFALPTIQSTCKTSSLVDMLTECSVAPMGYLCVLSAYLAHTLICHAPANL